MRPTTFPDCAPSPPATRHVLAAALLIALAPSTGAAATIVVTSPDDTNPAATDTCTLRQAILAMNAAAPKGNCVVTGAAFGSDDKITFAASSISGATTPGTIMLADSADASGNAGGALLITDERLTIDGMAWRGSDSGHYPDGVTIARPSGAANRFVVVHDTAAAGGVLALEGLAIRNGDNAGGGGGGIAMDAADLAMSDCRVSGNSANNGSGIWSPGSGAVTLTRCTIDGNVGGEYGGGVFSGTGNVTVTASTLSGNGNWYVTNGGAISAGGTLALVDSTISGNNGKRGAGIRSSGTLTLTRSVVAGNSSYYGGGGIHVYAGTATVTDSTVSNNRVRYSGAGLYSQGTLTIANSTIANNSSGHDGAGIALLDGATLHLDHATVAGNHSNSGMSGGIGFVTWPSFIPPWTGNATIDHSIVSGNTQGAGSEIHLGSAWTGSGNLISSPDVALGPLQDNGGPTPTMLPGPDSTAIDAIAPQDCTRATDQRGVARPSGAGCDIGAVERLADLVFANGFEPAPALRATH